MTTEENIIDVCGKLHPQYFVLVQRKLGMIRISNLLDRDFMVHFIQVTLGESVSKFLES